MRRPTRPPPSGFKIAIPTTGQKSVAVENRSAEAMKQQLYIHNDDSMVSPYISADAPQFVDPHAAPSANAEVHQAPTHQAKFIHVHRTNMYVLVDGGSLFHDEAVVGASEDDFSMSGGESSVGSNMRDQIVRDMTASVSRDSEFDDALAEVTTVETAPLVSSASGRQAGGRRLPRHAADFEGMELLSLIGGGQQGMVHAARLRNGMKCAVKIIDIHSATSANNDSERQGLKAGIVRELNMVKSLRDAGASSTQHLVVSYNATCVLKDHTKRLSIFMELMGPSVESLQRTIGRMPHSTVTKIRQQSFALKQTVTSGTPLKPIEMHGSSSAFHGSLASGGKERVAMANREPADRQTQCPEILLSLIAHDTLKGLHDLHTVHRRVHCDLKPANILVSEDLRTFKIGDFGCAVMLGKDDKVVQRGPALGSKIYRAPEQFEPTLSFSASLSSEWNVEGGVEDEASSANRSPLVTGLPTSAPQTASVRFDEKVDVWALGICLLELANGCHPTKPFQQDFWNFASKLSLRHMVLPIQCSLSFYDFIEKCLCRDPARRPSAQELLHHEFVRQYAGYPRKCLPMFINRLHKECEDYQRKARLESLRLSVVTATRRHDHEHHKRKNAATWRGFTHLLAPGTPPPTNDTMLFPQLGD